MKAKFLFIIAVLVYSCMLYAQPATIHLIRSKMPMAIALVMEVSVNDEVIGKLKVGEQIIYNTDVTGTHRIDFRIVNSKNHVTLDVEPGKVYYVKGEMTPIKLKMEVLNDDYGKSYISDSRNFKKDHVPYTVDHVIKAEEQTLNPHAEIVTNANEQQPTKVAEQNSDKTTLAKQTIALASKQKRLALVIGNGNYMHAGSLANPINDATDMATTLKGLGFDVTLVKNAGQASLKQAIDKFGQELTNYDIGLFYYAGHGLQSKNFNYFIPIDANLENEAQVEFDCVRTDRLLRVMENAGSSTNIIILDACRNNPFERSWNRSGQGSGLAFMDAPSGSLIAYATAPGKTASDGSGKNGLYTSALLKYIHEPGLTIEQMFKKVRESVSDQSNKDQVPWESTSLVGEFYFSTQAAE